MELTVIIQSKIYEVRGQQVMLDKDLAELYQVATGNLNKAVKRNLKRFPSDFMFQLTTEEWESLRFQIGSLDKGRGKYPKYLPYAFTEQGIAMLSGVLNSDTAIEININIMRAFVAVRRFIANPPVDRVSELQNELRELKSYIEEVFTDYNDINEDARMQLELINRTLAELQAQKRLADSPRNPIGFVKPKQ
ncbi:MAG: ORF6N domain-containing protein [Bacteroides intestinalis]|nr:ORF6N domain-containing protein [Bacteroides intestinalis]